MYEFIIDQGILMQYYGGEIDIVIPDSVSGISREAFADYTNLRSITIPESVTHIANGAFNDCNRLQKYILAPHSQSKAQTKMFLHAFGTQTLAFALLSGNLKTNPTLEEHLTAKMITKKFREEFIPQLIKKGEIHAFKILLSMIKKMHPEEIDQYIDLSTESGKAEITNALILYKNERYPIEMVFEMQNTEMEKALGLQEKTLADYRKDFKIAKIDDHYEIKEYKSDHPFVTVPAYIKNIPVIIAKNAFRSCIQITHVHIEDGVTSIGDEAFFGCEELQSITIPASVRNIGEKAFSRCKNVQNITVADGNPAYESVGNCLVEKESNTLLFFGLNGNIPDSIRMIAKGAFWCCAAESVTLPEGVLKIDDYAFYFCDKLESITLPESLTDIGKSAFHYCYKMKNINIPSHVTHIGEHAFFSCSSLQSLTLGDSVADIEEYAFGCCENLKTVTISDHVKTIGKNAFFHCHNLTICTPEGSLAETYAKENQIPYAKTSCKI